MRGLRRGFTLAEMTIVVLVIALAAAVAIPSLKALTHANLRKSSSMLASTIGYLYNQSQMKGLCLRLVMDLKEGTYHVEASDGPTCLLNKELEEVVRGARKEKPKKDELNDGRSSTSIGGWGGERPISLKVKRARFMKVNHRLLKPQRLPSGVGFKAVYVSHQADKYTTGRAFIHCLPMGFCERAFVYLSDGDSVYTLVLHPLTGRVKIHRGEKELTRDDRDRTKGDDKELYN